MQRETLLQLTEKRRRYLAGFDHHLLVCAGLGCPGNEEIVAELNRIVNERDLADRVLVRRTGCMGLCALGPLVRVEPDTNVYQGVRPADADEIVTALGREPVARLLLPPDLPFFTRQRRRVLALCGRIDPDNFDDYLAAGGYTAVSTALTTMRPAGVIRLIGDPEVRLREDPVRMLRAVRFAAKLGFRIDAEVEACMPRMAELLAEIPPGRLYEEVLKLFQGGFGVQSFELLRHYGLFDHLFPAVAQCLAQEEGGFPRMLIVRALESTDARVTAGKPVTPAFLFAALLWEPVRRAEGGYLEAGEPAPRALELAADDVLREQSRTVAFPRRFALVTRDIWAMQPRLAQTSGRRPARLIEQPRFRAGYDFLVLRAAAGEDVRSLAEWWTAYQEADPGERERMVKPAASGGARRRPRRRRTRRPQGAAEGSDAVPAA